MARMLVCYYSRSGHTEEMAKAVAEAGRTHGCVVSLQRVEETSLDDLEAADAIVVGSPTYYGTMAAQVKELFDKSVRIHGHLTGKVGGAFASAANLGGGNETTILDILKALLIHGMVIQGDHRGDHYGPVAINRPDDRSLRECAKLGKNVALLTQKLFP